MSNGINNIHDVGSRLVGETVTVYVEHFSFMGRIADSRSDVLIMAERRAHDASGGEAGVVISYIPYRKIQAITEF